MGDLIAADLFCGAGGVSVGLSRAGFSNIEGFDIVPQPNYPFEFFQDDALAQDLSHYDFIWASPPCQAYSFSSQHLRNKGVEYPDLLEKTRELLVSSGKPYIIENVVGAPLIKPVRLCGSHWYPELKVFRHRLFESNIPLKGVDCNHENLSVMKRRGDGGNIYTVAGHWAGTKEEWSDAMGINWMSKSELAQAIPPIFSEYLAKQVIEWINKNGR